MTLMVSIGRNIADAPMPSEEWEHFTQGARNALSDTVGQADTVHFGTGRWDGVAEDSAILTVYAPRLTQYPHLARRLGILADVYRQDAIAVTEGPTDMVRASDYAVAEDVTV